jgi:hypothetical protein
LRISVIALGNSPYLTLSDNCHIEVVASATPAANRYPLAITVRTQGSTKELTTEVKMSVRTSREAITSALGAKAAQRGISGVTIAVVLAAFAVVVLTIVQAAASGDAAATQSGIPGLIG